MRTGTTSRLILSGQTVPLIAFILFRLPFLQPQEYIMFSWVQSVSVSPFLIH
jgi:hypothetical protein